MKNQAIEEGDLLAYLEGEVVPHVEAALQTSPELQHELETLRWTRQLMQDTFATGELAHLQDLVDVAAGQATANQRLRVAAYVRNNPVAAQHLQTLEEEMDLGESPQPKGRLILPQFIAVPLAAVGLRSNMEQGTQQSFYAVELKARVTLRIAPPLDDHWQIEGYVTQDDQPVVATRVELSPGHSSTTDNAGFFTFQQLEQGIYQCLVHLEDGVVVVPDIEFQDDELDF